MRTQANGEVIRRLREERGLTVTQLARLADVSPGYMSRMENGERQGGLQARQRVAAVLETTITEISLPVPHVPRNQAAA